MSIKRFIVPETFDDSAPKEAKLQILAERTELMHRRFLENYRFNFIPEMGGQPEYGSCAYDIKNTVVGMQRFHDDGIILIAGRPEDINKTRSELEKILGIALFETEEHEPSIIGEYREAYAKGA